MNGEQWDCAGRFTTFYNGSCPVCRHEMEAYRRRAEAREIESLDWSDIMAEPQRLAALGITLEQAERRLIARDEQGRVLVGVDAFAEIWRRLPGYGWAAWLITRPGIHWLAAIAYDHGLARIISAWSRRRRRRLAREREDTDSLPSQDGRSRRQLASGYRTLASIVVSALLLGGVMSISARSGTWQMHLLSAGLAGLCACLPAALLARQFGHPGPLGWLRSLLATAGAAALTGALAGTAVAPGFGTAIGAAAPFFFLKLPEGALLALACLVATHLLARGQHRPDNPGGPPEAAA